MPDNPDAEPPCSHTRSAIIVFGKHAGRTLTVCTEPNCPVHNPREAARVPSDPPPSMPPPVEEETDEEAEQRRAEQERRMAECQAEQQRREEERRAEYGRQQQEYEAEVQRRKEQHKARLGMLERIVEQTPAVLNADQLRMAIELLLDLSP